MVPENTEQTLQPEKPDYLDLESLVGLIEEPDRSKCRSILAEHGERFQVMPGSSHNHQAWKGGYHDHVTEVLNLANVLYEAGNSARPLPFSKSDALLVLFLHDIEKPFRFELVDGRYVEKPGLRTKPAKREFRERFLTKHGITLSDVQHNAFTYVEGELDDYTNKERVMNELAGFCHVCDVWSARIWHDKPASAEDPWPGAGRIS